MFAEEPKEQIISVGPIRRKRKCVCDPKEGWGGFVDHPG